MDQDNLLLPLVAQRQQADTAHLQLFTNVHVRVLKGVEAKLLFVVTLPGFLYVAITTS
jgi:hypothetical protein